ncbi:hypothetical protein AG1IA_01426 [Rhizoctonia solani AG-1 IA]|nr:hypothetical protein AG1IA_01426 [Rhizoctonia solani AG-1 IA]
MVIGKEGAITPPAAPGGPVRSVSQPIMPVASVAQPSYVPPPAKIISR